MPSYKGISLILHKKHIPSSSPSLFTSYKSHQEYTGPYNITPRVDYVRWQEVCETSQEATELFSRFPHDIILRILRELDFTDIVSFSKVSRRCMTHTLDPYFWHSMLQRDWKGWHDYDTVLKKYNIHPVWNGNIKSTEEDTLALKRAYMTLATYKLYLAERKDESDSMKTLWEKEEFKLGHTKESNFGKVIKQKSKLFQCSVKFMYPPRGWYDVMWRIKVDKLIGEPEYAFDATVETIV
ncbi:11046_t:CDS:2 [Diversispora eburnea]|uniref:11046_t:CDS:1 n=1 Tax=Diversispora eburnea TaxID=1213867 RepID=A0A9N8ZJX6_9GLOM|nr:11046_t:CDS:2 [Diversispora eburnea]